MRIRSFFCLEDKFIWFKQILILLKDILFKSNKYYLIEINLLFELKKAFQTNHFLSFNHIFLSLWSWIFDYMFYRFIYPMRTIFSDLKSFTCPGGFSARQFFLLASRDTLLLRFLYSLMCNVWFFRCFSVATDTTPSTSLSIFIFTNYGARLKMYSEMWT